MKTEIKPIRPTTLNFQDDAEMKAFVEYATNPAKTTDDPGLDRLRGLLKNHKSIPERK